MAMTAAAAVIGRPPLERTLFKDIPRPTPREKSSRPSSARGSTPCVTASRRSEWTASGYGGAWERARRYFPGKTYLVRPGNILHDPRLRPGRAAVHGGPRIRLPDALRREPADVRARHHRRAITAGCSRRRTAGRRPPSGRRWGGSSPISATEEAHAALRKALGEALYVRLLKELREEDYHMIAGGLMHEGMHAGMDDALVARVQAEFDAGRRAVQWDELRAFMAEIGYHAAYCRWAAGDLAGRWRPVEGLLRELEGLRKRPQPPPRPRPSAVRKGPGPSRGLRRAHPAQDARGLAIGPAHAGSCGELPHGLCQSAPTAEIESCSRDSTATRAVLRRRPVDPSRQRSSRSGPSKRSWMCGASGRRGGGRFRRRSRIPRPSPGRSKTSAGPTLADAAAALMKRAGVELEKERSSS